MQTKTRYKFKEKHTLAQCNFRIGKFLLVVALAFYIPSNGQDKSCNCMDDITFLNERLKKTPAYTDSKAHYAKVFNSISEQAKQNPSTFECYYLMNKLALAINDRHLKIYGAKTEMIRDLITDSTAVNTFKTSEAYRLYPKVTINIDSLENTLALKVMDSNEGIYYLGTTIKIGVLQSTDRNEYSMVVLASENPIWERGQVLGKLIPYGKDYLRFIGGNLNSKRLITFAERIKNGTFLTYGFQKNPAQTDFSNDTKIAETFGIKELSNTLTYLKVGSFISFYPELAEAEKFYNIIATDLGGKELVLDLRNNGGGGNRNSNILLKMLKEIGKYKQIHVLVNHNTGSNAEQFAAKLKLWKNVTLYGDKTNGTISYEIKNSVYTLPCSDYIAELTSKKHSRFTSYESKGVQPDILLDYTTDWLDQVMYTIATN